MAARRLFTNMWLQSSTLGMTFRAADPILPVLMIQTRNKMSKTSPYGKRTNPMKKNKQDIAKAMPNITQMAKQKAYDRPIVVDSPGTIFSDYLPIRTTFLFTPAGLKERWGAFKAGLWTVYSIAVIKKHCKPFKIKEFAKEAQDLYIDLNKALVSKDKHKLQELATSSINLSLRQEYFPLDKHLHWRFVSAVERPKAVHVRVNPLETKDNLFAQITVRIHSKQVMAVKDKYGRHVKGSDKDIKDVLDYVVFERHIVNKYGKWRVCGKLFPQAIWQKQNNQRQLTSAAPSQ